MMEEFGWQIAEVDGELIHILDLDGCKLSAKPDWHSISGWIWGFESEREELAGTATNLPTAMAMAYGAYLGFGR